MLFLQGNNQQATALFRRLLSVAFFIWLAILFTQYYGKPVPEKPEFPDKSIPSNILIKQLTLPPVPELKPQTEKAARQNTALSNSNKHKPDNVSDAIDIVKNKADNLTLHKQQVEQVYQQLSDQGIDIQIAWPQRAAEQQTALRFMYKCVGVQFAVLNGNHITKVNQTDLSEYSDWVRIAQGRLSKKERQWLNAYSMTGTPIRLFPRSIDWRLAQYLANTLKGVPLTSFKANYQINNQKLYLTNIHLNAKHIKDNWMLYQSKC